jgi:hypothetical protein
MKTDLPTTSILSLKNRQKRRKVAKRTMNANPTITKILEDVVSRRESKCRMERSERD